MSILKQHVEKNTWKYKTAQLLTSNSLTQLFESKIPAIILPGFLSVNQCENIVTNLESLGMGTYSHVNHSVGRLGLAQMEYHLKKGKPAYFEAVESANKIFGQAINGSEDPITKLISKLAHATPKSVGIAIEESIGSYFAGTFRNVMTVGHLHFDYAPFEAKGWNIDTVDSQLSWNLYLNQPIGGKLRVYNRFYNPKDEKLRVKNEYYYQRSIIGNCEQFSYVPRVGDLVLFNSRNIHEVEPVTGNRYSLSSFIGRTDRSLILWS
ncbi:MAG: 2OG-Fe(II) oxygenase [Bdellovibrionales bacterium]|nr:2OG-Fe(II) oxygenase [Bdellovibrionales bacterium]